MWNYKSTPLLLLYFGECFHLALRAHIRESPAVMVPKRAVELSEQNREPKPRVNLAEAVVSVQFQKLRDCFVSVPFHGCIFGLHSHL